MNLKELRKARRDALNAYIKAHFEGTPNRFVAKLDVSQSYISPLLNGKKPFGETAALNLEEKIRQAGLMPIKLISPELGPGAAIDEQAYHLELKLLAAFRRLDELRRTQLVAEIAIEALNATMDDPRPRPTKAA